MPLAYAIYGHYYSLSIDIYGHYYCHLWPLFIAIYYCHVWPLSLPLMAIIIGIVAMSIAIIIAIIYCQFLWALALPLWP